MSARPVPWYLEKPYRTIDEECVRRGHLPDPKAKERQREAAQPVPYLLHEALGYHDHSRARMQDDLTERLGYRDLSMPESVTIDREREGDYFEVRDGAGRLISRKQVT